MSTKGGDVVENDMQMKTVAKRRKKNRFPIDPDGHDGFQFCPRINIFIIQSRGCYARTNIKTVSL